MLESLEQEYRREEDWCGSHDKLGSSADSDHLLPLISKHLEQKEAFLKVEEQTCRARAPSFSEHLSKTELLCVFQACTLARRNAEVFLKYIHRNNVSTPGAAGHARGPEQQVKGERRAAGHNSCT